MKVPPLPRLDLHKLLDSASYDHAIVLTYAFDPLFLENYCLANLQGLHNCKSISVFVDRGVYDKIIGSSHADRPKQANLRYLLHPISVPGVFHPKLILLASSTKGRLLVGSANFTRPGLTANAELVAAYDFQANDHEEFGPILRSAFRFARAISDRWPARNLTSNLQEMLRECPWLEAGQTKCENVELLTNLNAPLLSQLMSRVSGGIDSVSIVSRYFDETSQILETLVRETAARKIQLFTQNHCTNLNPEWLQHPLVKNGTVEIYLADYSSDDRNQSLHGKAIALRSSEGCLFAFGSANCTTPALLTSANRSNVEVLVVTQLLPRDAEGLLSRLMDPGSNSQRLMKPSQLVSVPIEKNDSGKKQFVIEILEAELDKERILIWLAEPLHQTGLSVKLEFPGGRFVRLLLKAVGLYEVAVEVDKEVARRLGQTSAVIVVEDRDGAPQSNRLLITNLLDVQTGTSIRKSRYVKEAEQDTAGLLSVLHDLRIGSDEDALRTFLTFCDIPMVLGPRPLWRPPTKQSGVSREGMRTLIARDFNVALSLHELALNFCERHFRKLRRHASDRRPEGIPNFFHIALAIGGVVESQIDRALSGLEARKEVTVDEWADFRNICDTYFLQYRELTRLLWEAYLSKLIREFPAKRICEPFEPELQPLRELAQQMLNFRARVEGLRKTRCLIRSGDKKGTPFGYFQSVFGDQRWPKYVGDMNSTYAHIASVIAGEPKLAKSVPAVSMHR